MSVQEQGLRYLLVGGVNTVFGFSVFAGLQLLIGEDIGYLAVLLIAWSINVTEAFLTNRYLVFQVRGQFMLDFGRFALVNVSSLVFNLIALPVAVDGFGLPVIAAQGIVLVIGVVLSFVAHRFFSFRRSDSEPH